MNDVKSETWQEVHDRVLWWMNDMAFKPPELLNGARGDHYFECMAQDLADTATGGGICATCGEGRMHDYHWVVDDPDIKGHEFVMQSTLSAMDRIDP